MIYSRKRFRNDRKRFRILKPGMKDTTLKELAETLGISVTTVSKALKGYADVSPKTREAVLKLAEELHFTPNAFAVNLRKQESKTIGVIIPEIVHHFFSKVLNGILDEAAKHGYLAIVLQSGESVELERKQVDLLINKRVDGILISLSNDSNDEAHLKEIIRRNIPLVQFDKISKLIPSTKVVINDRQAAFEATEHLILKGCRKIAHIRGPVNPQGAIDRWMGYKLALEKHGITYNPKLVYTCTHVTFEEGREFAKQILTDHPDVEGIFAITDLVAVGVISYFNENGFKVPENVALIGFSNWFMSQVITPQLSSIDQPGEEMGALAFNCLLEEIEARKANKPYDLKTISLTTSVVERQSSQFKGK